MPFREFNEFIPNTPYNFMPPEVWERGEYNQFIQQCGRKDAKYCLKYGFGDVITYQFRPRFVPGNLLPTAQIFGGTISATATGKATATGIGTASAVNQIIFNFTTGESTYITAIDDPDTVSVADDIFLSGNAVIVYPYESNNGFTAGVDANAGIVFCREAGIGASSLTAPNVVTNGQYFYVAVYVYNYTGGQLEVLIGGTSAGYIQANGLHEFYATSAGTSITFQCTSGEDFAGCLALMEMESYEVFSDYYYNTYTEDFTQLLNISIFGTPQLDASFTNGLIEFNVLIPENGCQCGFNGISEAYPCETENIIQNGTFEDFTGWESFDPATVERNASNDTLQFKGAAAGAYAGYTGELNCPLLCGVEYTVAFEVTAYVSGNLEVNIGGTLSGVNITGTGNYTFDVTIGEDCSGLIRFIAALGGADMQIDNISILYKEPQYKQIGISELICVCDPEPCEMTIDYRNDVDAFGYAYEFDPTFYNRIRVCARLKNAIIQNISFENNKDTFGNYAAYYANADKVETLETEWIPPYLANAINIALQHSDVKINGVNYILKAAFSQTTNDDTELQKITAQVVKQDQRHTFMTRK